MKTISSLANHLLIATPALENTPFAKSVIYLHKHSEEGAIGVVINKSLPITLRNLLQYFDIKITDQKAADLPILSGGPVGSQQGFILHSPINQSTAVDEQLLISSSKEILYDIGQGNGPHNFIITLGYAGWEEQQLEQEINCNNWLITAFDHTIPFATPIENRWQKAIAKLGIDIRHFSDQTGHI